MSLSEFQRLEKEAQSKAGEKKTAASVKEMFAAQESEKGRPSNPHPLQFRQKVGVIAEAQARVQSRDRLVLLTGQEMDPAEVEMMKGVSGLPGDRFAAEGERAFRVLLFPGQAIAETGEDERCAVISGGLLEKKAGQSGVFALQGDKASPDQVGPFVPNDLP